MITFAQHRIKCRLKEEDGTTLAVMSIDVSSSATVARHHNSSLYTQKPKMGEVSCASHNSQSVTKSSVYQ